MNNEKIYERIKKIGERLKKEYHAEKVIVFGSYATGEYTVHSDLDILVIAPTKEGFLQRISSVKSVIRDLKNGIPISPIVLTPEEIKRRREIGDQFIVDILGKGLPLSP